MVVLAGLIWLAFLWMRPDGGEVADSPDDALPASATTVVVADAAPVVAGDQLTVAAGAAALEPASAAPSDAQLPPSQNARPDLGIGMRVAIVPGLQLALRSEPGADAGQVVGAMTDGDVVTIIGGPRTTQGTSDTIVWWLVQLDNGSQAWAAANTSEQTLLVPAP